MTTATRPAAPAQTGESLRERVLNEVPGRRELAAALAATLRLATPEPVNAFAERSRIYAAAAEEFVASGVLPSDFDARLAEVGTKAAAAAGRGEHLAQVRTIIRGRLEECERRGLDIALAALSDELQRIVAEVREIEPALTGVSATGTALRAGGAVADAARRLLDLVDRHQTLRGAQLDFHVIAMGGASNGQRARQLLDTVGRVANAAELNPARARREDNRTTRPSWPEPVDGEGYLRWLAGPDQQPWVPSTAALEAAYADLRRREREADHARDKAAGLILTPMQQRTADRRMDSELERLAIQASAAAETRGLSYDRDY